MASDSSYSSASSDMPKAFDRSTMPESIKRIHNEVIVTLLEDPPFGVREDSYSSTIEFLENQITVACRKMYNQYQPTPELVSTSAVQLIALIRSWQYAYRRVVPPEWI
ncbi:hypothetical protein V8F20_002116 [Naviculisporaceae sp. PSN 640]